LDPRLEPWPFPWEGVTLFEVSFETGYYGFHPNASGVSVVRTQEEARTGTHSLLVSGRSAGSHGARIDVTEYSTPFDEHEITFWLMPQGNEPVQFSVAIQFVHRGETHGRTMWDKASPTPLTKTVTAYPGEWTELRAYRPSYDFDSLFINIQTTGSLASFYIDDVTFRNVSIRSNFTPDVPRLFMEYQDYFPIGTAVILRDIRPGPRFDFLQHHFNVITAGNDMKPDHIQPSPGNFNWYVADEMMQTAQENDLMVIGHTLAWHSQSPAWMNPEGIDRDEAIRNLESHITEFVTRYRGQIAVWDVVNEAFPSSVPLATASNWRANLRRTPWLAAIGYEYIEIAFRAAHAADPNAILIYNDYNLNQPGKREAVFHMLQELLERGVPIHGIGMQAHYSLDTSPIDVRNSIARFAELGVEIHITEMDITVPNSTNQPRLTEAQELRQAILYARLFMIFKEFHEYIARVTLWGLDDATSWRAERFPLIFNRDLTPKLSYWAILDPEGFLREQGIN
jgi:endo-1,4-beta-xylanase